MSYGSHKLRPRSMDHVELSRLCRVIGKSKIEISREIGTHQSSFSRMTLGDLPVTERVAQAVRKLANTSRDEME